MPLSARPLPDGPQLGSVWWLCPAQASLSLPGSQDLWTTCLEPRGSCHTRLASCMVFRTQGVGEGQSPGNVSQASTLAGSEATRGQGAAGEGAQQLSLVSVWFQKIFKVWGATLKYGMDLGKNDPPTF